MKEKLLIFTTLKKALLCMRVDGEGGNADSDCELSKEGVVFSTGSLRRENTLSDSNILLFYFYLITRLVISRLTFSPGLTSMEFEKGRLNQLS